MDREVLCNVFGSLDERMRDHVCACVVLAGGIANSKDLEPRLLLELQRSLPDTQNIHVHRMSYPELAAFRGGTALAADPVFESLCVSKAEWEEHGSRICTERFSSLLY